MIMAATTTTALESNISSHYSNFTALADGLAPIQHQVICSNDVMMN